MVIDPNTCLYSNATYTASNNGDRFKTWGVILDNNINTYFHSDYSGANSEDGLDHYIRIMAPGDDTFRHFNLSFTTRNSTGAAAKIQSYRIDASADGSTWKAVKAVSSGLNVGAAVTNSSGELSVPEGTKYIRFVVTKTGGSAGGHPYFAISEISVENRKDDFDCVPDEKYKNVQPEHMANVAKQIGSSRDIIDNPSATVEDLNAQYDNLRYHTNLLYAKMGGEMSGVDYISTDSDNSDSDYYDIQGRRVSHPDKGTYIRHHGNQNSKINLK